MGEPPARIVAVWLIAVSIFRHGTGLADCADIRLAGKAGDRRVL